MVFRIGAEQPHGTRNSQPLSSDSTLGAKTSVSQPHNLRYRNLHVPGYGYTTRNLSALPSPQPSRHILVTVSTLGGVSFMIVQDALLKSCYHLAC
jgi:hypothetical protein